MTYMHDDVHHHHDVDVYDGRTGFGSGLLVALVTLLVIFIIAAAVMWAHPWSSGSSRGTPNVPGVGQQDGGGGGGGQTDGGPGGSQSGQ